MKKRKLSHRMRCLLFASVLYITFGCSGFAQVKVVILGSSTAAGTGASSYNNSWVGKYTTYVQGLSSANAVINLAVSGFASWNVMPTGSNVGEDPNHNITKALSYNPNVIIVNLPSNDAVNNTSVSLTMANFRTLRQVALAANVAFWITTSQPRNLNPSQLMLLLQTRDSVIAQFGSNSIDFFSGIANADGTINPLYNSGDGIHVNDAAHDIFYQRVQAKPILGNTLPLSFLSFSAIKMVGGVQLKWNTDNTGVERFDLEKSLNGSIFTRFATTAPQPSGWQMAVDTAHSTQAVFYRIRLIAAAGVKYSAIIKLGILKQNPVLDIYPNPAKKGQINWLFSTTRSGRGYITLTSGGGASVIKKEFVISTGYSAEMLTLPQNLPHGLYVLAVFDGVERFAKTVILE